MSLTQIHEIPYPCSNILLYYLQSLDIFELSKLKQQYEAELKRNPQNDDISALKDMVTDIISQKQNDSF